MLAHDAAMLDIPFDPHKLFRAEDDEVVWFSWLVDRVDASRREQHARQEAAMRAARAH